VAAEEEEPHQEGGQHQDQDPEEPGHSRVSSGPGCQDVHAEGCPLSDVQMYLIPVAMGDLLLYVHGQHLAAEGQALGLLDHLLVRRHRVVAHHHMTLGNKFTDEYSEELTRCCLRSCESNLESILASSLALRMRLTIHFSASSGVMLSLSASMLSGERRGGGGLSLNSKTTKTVYLMLMH
ncbi:hypothetical protein F7725_025476, partial [Dissostichus mawsoni]